VRRPPEHYYMDAEKRDLLVMRVCGYLRRGDVCRGCPQWEQGRCGDTRAEYDKVKRCCRAMAEELIAVVHEALAKGPEVVAQDNDPWVPVLDHEE